MSDDRLFEKTTLWRRTLRRKGNDPDSRPRERLRAGYEAFRRNVATLVDQIQKNIPDLTLHDMTHLDAVWNCADVIAGPDYALNPAETFVLGGAILLHDAALTIAAFPGGISELKQTAEWRDSAAAILERARVSNITERLLSSPPKPYEFDILFAVLRALHGKRAEHLADLEIDNKQTGKRFRLLEDDSLRHHYGYVIGRIAASHSWSIEDTSSRLPKRVGAIGGLPNSWSIDPLKLACLLRCADAAQIDQRRAPDFLYALLRLRGLSETHWRAQNKLAQPIPDPDDPGALLFTSTQPYLEDDADAWWLAYDLVRIVDRELRSSDALLRDTKRKPLRISRVRDADSPERLSRHIETVGWEPVNAELHITNVEHVARMLGGFELYGENPLVPFRELIQNAADAVRARRFIDIHNEHYQGRITLALRRESTKVDTSVWLDVEDNGVGMSERILTGPLLDFGTSLWRDTLVEQEFPGLRGGQFQPTGQFGIGFYSVFMIAERVVVASRRFDAGYQDGSQLVFKKGLSSRPILIKQLPHDFGSELSTRVSVCINPKLADRVLSVGSGKGVRRITFAARIASLCPSLDCDVHCKEFGKASTLGHRRRWYDQEGAEWLHEITMPYGGVDRKFRDVLLRTAKRLQLIKEGEKILGRAAISLSSRDAFSSTFSMGHMTIGGLSADENPLTRILPRAEGSFAGVVEAKALKASRYSTGPGSHEPLTEIAASRRSLEKWAEGQLRILSGETLSVEEQDAASTNFLSFDILVPQYVCAHRYRVGASIRSIADLELININSVWTTPGTLRIACPLYYGSVHSSYSFGLDESAQMTELMNEFTLTELLLPTFDFGEWCRIPSGAAGARIKCFVNAIVQVARMHDFSVKTQQLKSKKGIRGVICFLSN